MSGVSASPPSFTSLQLKLQPRPCFYASSLNLRRLRVAQASFPRAKVVCYSSTSPGGGLPPGEGDVRSVLDAFFLGKALAEALNERIESTVGEFLGAIGMLRAEQQRQVMDFQEEVLKRAKKAKEKAAREALEAQGVIPKPTSDITSAVTNDSSRATAPSTPNAGTPEMTALPSDPIEPASGAGSDLTTDSDPMSGVSNDN